MSVRFSNRRPILCLIPVTRSRDPSVWRHLRSNGLFDLLASILFVFIVFLMSQLSVFRISRMLPDEIYEGVTLLEEKSWSLWAQWSRFKYTFSEWFDQVFLHAHQQTQDNDVKKSGRISSALAQINDALFVSRFTKMYSLFHCAFMFGSHKNQDHHKEDWANAHKSMLSMVTCLLGMPKSISGGLFKNDTGSLQTCGLEESAPSHSRLRYQ